MTQTRKCDPQTLSYQRNRTLNDVPAYSVGLQLRLSSGERVYIAVSRIELASYFEPEVALHYDLEARLVKVSEPNRYWRRGLSHRVVYSRKRTAEEGGGLERVVLSEEEADAVVTHAHQAVRAVYDELTDGRATIEFGKPDVEEAQQRIRPLLERAARFDSEEARRDAQRFTEIYGRVAVLPPDEYNALVVQATQGCAYRGCAFCELYKDVPYHARSPEQFEKHVRAVIDYHGEALRARRSIFFGEANALTLPQETVLADLRVVSSLFQLAPIEDREVPATWWLGSKSQVDGVASFLDVFTGPRRTASQFGELRRAGLRKVYIGLETGDDALLKWLRKPASAEAIIETVRALKAVDIQVGVIVLLGAGGRKFSENHVRQTARVLNELPLGRGDYVYFSPLIIYPGGPYDAQALTRSITALTPTQMNAQEQAIRLGLQLDRARGRPHLARYELELFSY